MHAHVAWPPGLIPVRGLFSVPHVLADETGAVILDTGLPPDAKRIRRVIERAGLKAEDVRAILLTHGHVDHAGGLAELKAWTHAPVYAHPLEQPHIDGTYPYVGLARICGALEAAARGLMNYRRVAIDVAIREGDELPFWGGLRVVELPGHTLGHCGFYSKKRDVLFTGDAWVRFFMRTQVSPRIFSDDISLVPDSLRKARAIGARWVVPGHYDLPGIRQLRQRFENLCDAVEERTARKI